MMNIFCCPRPLWLDRNWLCTVREHKVMTIEGVYSAVLPIYLDWQPKGTVCLLEALMEASGGCLWQSLTVGTRTEAVLLGDKACYEQLLRLLPNKRLQLGELFKYLKWVLENILDSEREGPKVLSKTPENLQVFVRYGDIVETMRHYPFQNKPIAVDYAAFSCTDEAADFLLALRSKGYEVAFYVRNDADYQLAEQLKSDYIIYC